MLAGLRSSKRLVLIWSTERRHKGTEDIAYLTTGTEYLTGAVAACNGNLNASIHDEAPEVPRCIAMAENESTETAFTLIRATLRKGNCIPFQVIIYLCFFATGMNDQPGIRAPTPACAEHNKCTLNFKFRIGYLLYSTG